MCPNTEFFLVCIFPHSDWIRRNTKYLSEFSPNAWKYGPEKTSYLDTFHIVIIWLFKVYNMYQQKNNTCWFTCNICCNSKTLLQAYYFANISLKILDTTTSTLQSLNSCLREMPKKFLMKCAYKTSCSNRFAC